MTGALRLPHVGSFDEMGMLAPSSDHSAGLSFAAVACVIQSADVLELHPSGHRRAVIEWTGGEVKMKRVGP